MEIDKSSEIILKDHGLRNTVFRTRVLTVFLDNSEMALTSSQVEDKLAEYDRITLYRTLKSFEQSGIIHQVLDSSNDAKYALCNDNCDTHSHNDDHAHFHCSSCNVTSCLTTVLSEPMNMPLGYSTNKMHLSITGLCPQCNVE